VNEADVHRAESTDLEPLADAVDEKEALRLSIERNEAELREAVEELTTVVKNDITLGAYIVERPWTWLAGGLAFGLLLGLRR
jgi:ElaB/YqjD/DUF883 family membrane-anchored ribosome-binding protein